MRYVASYMPIMKPAKVLAVSGTGHAKERSVDTMEFVSSLNEDDELVLMMGSTNTAVALGAHNRGARVLQLSRSRALGEIEEVDENGRVKIAPVEVLKLSNDHPELFYLVERSHRHVLVAIDAWQKLSDLMEARKAYANLTRARMQQSAIAHARYASTDELKASIEARVGGSKTKPSDPVIQYFNEQEQEAEKELKKALGDLDLYHRVFEPIEGMGPRLAARFIAAIERIKRYPRPEDLLNDAGLLPRGADGRLPSKRRAKEMSKPLNRNPVLNNACFMFQDQVFKFNVDSRYGQLLREQVAAECCSQVEDCSQETRKRDKELRKQHNAAMKRARINISRMLLREIWEGWTALATA